MYTQLVDDDLYLRKNENNEPKHGVKARRIAKLEVELVKARKQGDWRAEKRITAALVKLQTE